MTTFLQRIGKQIGLGGDRGVPSTLTIPFFDASPRIDSLGPKRFDPNNGRGPIALGEVKLARQAASITSVRFIPQRESAPREVTSDHRRSRSRRSAAPAPALPAHLPLRDRVMARLQPPIDWLLADNRLWLPFEPFDFQYDGIQFLASRWGALLADEMGLGKTMQTILAVRLLLRAGLIRSVILVCPKPLVSNWIREFSLWADEIPVAVIGGAPNRRRHLWLADPSPVKLANYESLSRDEEIIQSSRLAVDLVVLDEAQRIKNRDSKTARVARSLRRKRSWALTGTPVENHPGDLASLLSFIGQEDPIDERPATLRELAQGMLLRRTKEMVLDDLPPRLVRDVWIDLTPAQRERYDKAETDGVAQLGHQREIAIEHVFELIGRLKQICNFDPVTGASAKADQLAAELEEIAGSGRKAIVFSQWAQTLDQLAGRLAPFAPLVYHGAIRARQREEILREFKDNPARPVLLLSYGTGAVGLNLQFANYVILFDRWWNPAVEDQAINRAHRIGQKDRVYIQRMLTPGTIEERIAAILEKKRELFRDLIDDHDPALATGLTREDLLGLFDFRVRRAAA